MSLDPNKIIVFGPFSILFKTNWASTLAITGLKPDSLRLDIETKLGNRVFEDGDETDWEEGRKLSGELIVSELDTGDIALIEGCDSVDIGFLRNDKLIIIDTTSRFFVHVDDGRTKVTWFKTVAEGQEMSDLIISALIADYFEAYANLAAMVVNWKETGLSAFGFHLDTATPLAGLKSLKATCNAWNYSFYDNRGFSVISGITYNISFKYNVTSSHLVYYWYLQEGVPISGNPVCPAWFGDKRNLNYLENTISFDFTPTFTGQVYFAIYGNANAQTRVIKLDNYIVSKS